MGRESRATRWRASTVIATSVLVGTTAMACVGGNSTKTNAGNGKVTSDKNSTITVWADATRLPGFKLYQKSHPNVKMKIITVDESSGASILGKIQLFNRTNKGWPDVLWLSDESNLASLVDSSFNHFAEPLDKLIPADVKKNYGTVQNACKFNGKTYCLKNDIAQTVLYYNKATMAKFGYKIPTTMGQFEQLGLRVAKEHPGYYVQDNFSPNVVFEYYWPSGCPITKPAGTNKVVINYKDPKCTRVTAMLDKLVKAGSIPPKTLSDKQTAQAGSAGKLMMSIGATWFGGYYYKKNWAFPTGQLAVAPMPKWQGESKAWSGADGGGGYVVSRHSKNIQGAYDMINWMATNNDFQSTSVTMPAYPPAQQAWAKKVLAPDPVWAANPLPVFKQQAPLIRPTYSYTRYDPRVSFGQDTVPTVQGGKTIASTIDKLQSDTVALAKTDGYDVATTS